MASSFPLSIKRWAAPKRDYIDWVDAARINEMGDEISSIEQTLGADPHIGEVALDPTWKWASVKERLNFMMRGKHHPYTHITAPTYLVKPSDKHTYAVFNAPSATFDTHKQFSGNGIKLKRTGYYSVHAHAHFAANPLKGNMMLSVRSADKFVGNANFPDYGAPTGWPPGGKWLNVDFMCYAVAGTVLQLSTNVETPQTANGKYSVGYLTLQAMHLRDA